MYWGYVAALKRVKTIQIHENCNMWKQIVFMLFWEHLSCELLRATAPAVRGRISRGRLRGLISRSRPHGLWLASLDAGKPHWEKHASERYWICRQMGKVVEGTLYVGSCDIFVCFFEARKISIRASV